MYFDILFISILKQAHSYRTYQGFTCLMQISTRNADYIIDTLELRDKMEVLNEMFTDPAVVKVSVLNYNYTGYYC